MPGIDDNKAVWEGSGLSHDTIAAQCCSSGGTCSRTVDEKCVAGHSRDLKGDITEFTYAKTEEFCTANGLEMCKQSCAGKGCFYNYHPVYSSLPCPPPVRRRGLADTSATSRNHNHSRAAMELGGTNSRAAAAEHSARFLGERSLLF
jgi:hypothetical protein